MIISIAHQKGGVGKSTIAFNLAVELEKHYKVEIIDLDRQKTVTAINTLRTTYNLKPLKINYLADEEMFKEFYKNKENNTVYIFDTGGFDSALNRNAMYFSDIIVTPVSDKFNEISGLMTFKEILKELKEITGNNIRVNVLLNNINPKVKNLEVKNFISTNDEFSTLDTVLRTRVDYDKSVWLGKTVCEYNKNSKASKEFSSFVKEIRNKLKQIEKEK